MKLTITNEPVSLSDLKNVVFNRAEMVLGPERHEKIRKSEEYLQKLFKERRVIYAVTTGAGPHGGTYLLPENTAPQQISAVYNYCTGMGEPLTKAQTRAIMACRLLNISTGVSGTRLQVSEKLAELINKGIYPVVPSMGTVGASGDLAPLAHLAEVLMGGGKCIVEGKQVPTRKVFEKEDIEPLEPTGKDSCGLINGTAAMTGIAAVNQWNAEGLMNLALRLGFAASEILHGKAIAYHPAVARCRPHPGQVWVVELLEPWVKESKRLTHAEKPAPVLPKEIDETGILTGQPPKQNEYSLRCLPQLYGAVKETLDFHARTVQIEMNSATDNPLISYEEGLVLEAGNFYGQHVANVSDALSNAVTQCAVHAERIVARLIEPVRNRGLSAYLQGKTGSTDFCCGFVGTQLTATSIVGEMRCYAIPASIQSIDTNQGVQDVNTMGTIGARKAGKLIDMLFDLIAIEAVTVAQAIDIAEGDIDQYCSSTRELYGRIREKCQFISDDRPLRDDFNAVSEMLKKYVRK